jgi:hypothetical protein
MERTLAQNGCIIIKLFLAEGTDSKVSEVVTNAAIPSKFFKLEIRSCYSKAITISSDATEGHANS